MSKREAFFAQAVLATDDACRLWPFAVRKSSGYGAHSFPLGACNPKRNVDAHVYACTIAHGERPSPEHEAAHSCGNKLCCNGRHLRWATRVENMADAKAHGTLRGGGRYRQRLTDEDVVMIRTSPLSLVELARSLDMEPAYLGSVRRGRARAKIGTLGA